MQLAAAAPSTPAAFRRDLSLGFLDGFAAELAQRPEAWLVEQLSDRVDDVRRSVPEAQWRLLAGEIRAHPIGALLLEDPCTRRALEKPRGSAGDAVMLDMLYGPATPSLSPIGAAVFAAMQARSGVAVRQRRDRLAAAMDAVVGTVRRPVVVHVGCGHARELGRSAAFAAGAIDVTCIDHDVESLAVVARDHPAARVVHGSVRQILAGRVVLPRADLITCAGLFDSLNEEVAMALMTRFIEATNRGGRILVANVASDSTDRGAMEAFMNWWLVTRSEDELRDLARYHALRSVRTSRDVSGRIISLDIIR